MYNDFSFTYNTTTPHSARVGTIHTPHGSIPTPNFIFCATKASIKGIPAHQMEQLGVDVILSNTYHLMLNPGSSHIAARGGLHKFMNWNKPLLTDSGGYQVFSMGHGSISKEIKKGSGRKLPNTLLSITEEGVTFKSYINGSTHLLTPEKAITIQQQLGADLVMQFDECTPYHVDKSYTRKAMQRSIRWGDRCLTQFKHSPSPQALYAILQGGVYQDLRKESGAMILEQDFWGNAIGGSLGKDKTEMFDVIAHSTQLLDRNKPIHLLGIGDIPDIFWGVKQGIDTFDCVHPTRCARHGHAIVPAAVHPTRKLNLFNAQYAHEDSPMDDKCRQFCCTHYSRAYIHHLFKAKELLGMYLLSIHNIAQMSRLMQDIRLCVSQSSSNTTEALEKLEKFWLKN